MGRGGGNAAGKFLVDEVNVALNILKALFSGMEVRRSDLKSVRTVRSSMMVTVWDCWSGRCSVSSRTSEAWVEVRGESGFGSLREE